MITFFNLRCLRTCACWSATVHECIYAPHVKCSLARFFWACHCELQRIYWFKSTSFDIFGFFLKKKLQSAIFNFQKKNVFSFLADTRRKNLLSTIYIKHFYHRSKVTEHRERKENPPDIPEFAVFTSCQARQSDLSSQFFTATREWTHLFFCYFCFFLSHCVKFSPTSTVLYICYFMLFI